MSPNRSYVVVHVGDDQSTVVDRREFLLTELELGVNLFTRYEFNLTEKEVLT